MDAIISNISSIYPLTEQTIQELSQCVTKCRFPKKHLLIEADKRCKYAYFIEQGITRSFWVVNGEEITTSFSVEGGIVFSMDELYYGTISEEFVETLEETTVYRIAICDLKRLFCNRLDFSNWGRIIHQNEYRRLHRSHKERLTLSVRERYLAFVNQFPDVCQRVNLRYIASYIGTTPSTLSRIRLKRKADR